jgi:cbb3-type cytochrome oxidase subunit 3
LRKEIFDAIAASISIISFTILLIAGGVSALSAKRRDGGAYHIIDA